MKRLNTILSIFVFLYIAVLGVGCGGTGSGRMNIVLITIDTLRADRLGFMGYDKAKTPVLDRLAAKGTVFKHCYSTSPTTLASHTAIMTGCYPRTLNVSRNGFVVPSSALTLAEILKDKGYDTAAFVSSYALDPMFGLIQGFEYYDACRTEKQTNEQDFRKGFDTVDAALDWLRERGDSRKPLFLWLHLFDPHAPYDPPSAFVDMFDPGYSGDFSGSMDDLISIWQKKRNPEEADLRHIRALYDGEIAYEDSALGKFTAGIGALRAGKGTIIIITADHGESLEQRGEIFTHGKLLYESEIRVPLVMTGKIPGKMSIPENTSIESPVRTIDILPTILDMIDVEKPAFLPGESFLPLMNGAPSKERIAFAEATKPYSVESSNCRYLNEKKSKMIVMGKWKYIRTPYSGREELYDLETDPYEKQNLIESEDADTQRIIRNLSNRLDIWLDSFRKTDTQVRQDMDPEVREHLRSLGYID